MFLAFVCGLILVGVDLLSIVGLSSDSEARVVHDRVLATLAWLFGAWVINQFIRYVLLDVMVARAIGGPVPGALKAIVTVVVILLAITGIVGVVFDRSVTAFLATLGAGSVVLGFAVRNLIADVFTGLAINLDRSFVIGDWVQVNEGVSGLVVGQIEEIGWRCTTLMTEEKTNVVIPNGLLGMERMVNITRPNEVTRYESSLIVEFSVPPERVKRVLLASLQVLADEPGFDTGLVPAVLVSKPLESGVEYTLRYWIRPWNPLSPTTARDRALGSALSHLHAAGIALAYPKRDVYTAPMPQRQIDGHSREDLCRMLGRLELFHDLQPEDLGLLVEDMKRQSVPAGDMLVRQGEEGDSLFVVIEGVIRASMTVDGKVQKLADIEPGSCFGEMSLLTGESRAASLEALTPAVVYEIDKRSMSPVMENRPELADSLAMLIAERKLSSEAVHDRLRRDGEQTEVNSFAHDLVTRMREFLGLKADRP